MDVLIQGGTVVDGTGSPAFEADVAIAGGKIAGVGKLEPAPGARIVDARGLVVAPGFIDIHSHSDFTLFQDPRAVSSILQGVTLEVVGNCGHGCAPITDPRLAAANIYGYEPEYELPWRSVADYLDRLDQARPAVNVATLVPNGNLRLAVAGMVDRASNPGEVRAMKKLLEQGLEEGAFGYSTGLEYVPERGCSEEEVQELCGATASRGRLYATHTRNLAGQAHDAIAEPIRASAASGVSLQISHISVVARLQADGRAAIEQALEQVDAAARSGLDVAFDMHTRHFGTTHLSAALPGWALEGGPLETERRLRDLRARAEMKKYASLITALAQGDWNRIVVFESKIQPEISRRSIAELSAERGTDPFDTIYDILLAEIQNLHGLLIVAFAYREEEIRAPFLHPLCMAGSDATTMAPDGPFAGKTFHGAYTWAAWFYRHFVRDRRILTLEEAVRRLTSLPAQRLRLRDRGTIRPGACADLAIFNPISFQERGDTFEPNRTATGMEHVFVNGVQAVSFGRIGGERAGQVLRA